MGTLAMATLGSALPEEQQVGIVDTHQHLWDLNRLKLPWLPSTGPLAGDHLMEHYLKDAEGLGIQRTIYMEVDVRPEQHLAEAEYVLDLCRKRGNPMVGAVLGGRPADPAFPSYLRRFRGNRYVRGIRQVLHSTSTPKGYCLQPDFIRGIRHLGELGLTFDVCLPEAYLDDCVKLAEACPDTRLILDHCGNPSVQAGVQDSWKRNIARIAERPNVACKISGIVATAKPGAWSAEDLAPFILHCREAFGPDRILFGSDWPVCKLAATLRQWVTALRQIISDWPTSDQRKLLRENAVRWYRLS